MSVDRRARLGLRTLVLGYLAVLLLVPVGLVFWRTFEHGLAAGVAVDHHAGRRPRLLADARDRAHRRAAEHDLRRDRRAGARARALPRQGLRRRRDPPALRALAGGHRPGAAARLRDAAAGSRCPSRSSSRCRGWCSPRSSSRCPSWCARWCRCCARSATSRSRRRPPWAPRRWQAFWRITLPAIRWGVAYGVVLTTARAIGEFGAVSVVSGRIAGQTQTLTLLVEQRFQNFDLAGAYAASALLGVIAIVDAAGHDAAQAAKGPRHDLGRRRDQAVRRLPRARRRVARGRRTARSRRCSGPAARASRRCCA